MGYVALVEELAPALALARGSLAGPRKSGKALRLGRLSARVLLLLHLQAHGTAVGLPSDADMGNSEVGHNALGAGGWVLGAASPGAPPGRLLCKQLAWSARWDLQLALHAASLRTAHQQPTSHGSVQLPTASKPR